MTHVRSFQDSHGAWRVVGLIENGWDRPVAKIVYRRGGRRFGGQVIDHGEDISAYPLNLQPGQHAPFSAWIKRDFPGAQRFQVAVDECVVAETQERSPVQVRGGRLSFDTAGRGHITANWSTRRTGRRWSMV